MFGHNLIKTVYFVITSYSIHYTKLYEIEGDHYFMPLGWDGPFADFIDLDWITRYMIIDPEGNIKLFEATKANNIT